MRPRHSRAITLLLPLLVTPILSHPTALEALASSPTSISNATLSLIVNRLATLATRSWELGARAQALTELNAPFYSVLTPSTPIPPPAKPQSDANLTDVINIAKQTVATLKSNAGGKLNNNTALPLMPDGSSGDPASLGVAVLLANWTGASGGGLAQTDYADAAAGQLKYLLENAPKTDDGAISHRADQVQLWSDSTFMVPPFLAYYAVLTSNSTLLHQSYDQLRLYRQYLQDSDKGLWKHIVLGEAGSTDEGFWSTGNAWAAAGMLRVLGTIQNSPFSSDFGDETNDLKNWIIEILDGMYGNLGSSNLFTNYANDSSSFLDASSTALITASTYRLALLTKTYRHVPAAEKCRVTLSGNDHIDPSGNLVPTVNPQSWHSPSPSNSFSPEGQAFLVMMHAAWRDWVAEGSPGKNGAIGVKVGFAGGGWWTVVGLSFGVGWMLS